MGNPRTIINTEEFRLVNDGTKYHLYKGKNPVEETLDQDIARELEMYLDGKKRERETEFENYNMSAMKDIDKNGKWAIWCVVFIGILQVLDMILLLKLSK